MRIDAYNQISQIYQTNKPKKAAQIKTEKATDEYKISKTARDYQVAKNAVEAVSDVREDKVAEIKDAMLSGTYNVSSQEIAESIVGKFFGAIG